MNLQVLYLHLLPAHRHRQGTACALVKSNVTSVGKTVKRHKNIGPSLL